MAPMTCNHAMIFPSIGELGTNAISDPSLSEDPVEKDPVGSFSPAAQTSRRSFETTPSAACANIEQAVVAAENVPDVHLLPPLEGGTAPQELFTSKTGWHAIRSRSGGSLAGPAALPKKRRNRDKQQAPLTHVWGTIIDAYCTGSQSYLSGLGGIAPPVPRSAPSSVVTNSSFPSCSAPPPYHAHNTSSFREPSCPPFQGLSNSAAKLFWCIFCGGTDCRKRACGTTRMAFISFSNGFWQTAQDEQICFKFNG
ncbi:hypothetical protein BS17DRAFT_881108 [Gyrodon lividus]|nr:hypothetical protein BS17DRAFT_881108 [Gyrodon lividus]